MFIFHRLCFWYGIAWTTLFSAGWVTALSWALPSKIIQFLQIGNPYFCRYMSHLIVVFDCSGLGPRSRPLRWSWSVCRHSPAAGLSLPSRSWASGLPGPGLDCSSSSACAFTMVSSRWSTSTTTPSWPTWLCQHMTARASTSTVPCSVQWARCPSFSLTASGTRKTSTPSDSSAWL